MKIVALIGVFMIALYVAPESHAGVLDSLVDGTGAAVKTVVVVTHQVVHVVQNVAGSIMSVLHSALDVFNVPFEGTS